jgi:hypothetical protein
VRLKELVARREQWRDELRSVRRMHGWVLEAEAILSGSWAAAEEAVTNAGVALRFDAWAAKLKEEAGGQQLTETEGRCLRHFLQVTASLRPQLIACYDVVGLPRTNNDMEGFIRAIKTRYRRVSGRKNWNRYLLRYGRRVAYYEAQVRSATGEAGVHEALAGVTPAQWREARAEQRVSQENQLKQYRFRHKRATFLQGLEARWAAVAQRTPLLP